MSTVTQTIKRNAYGAAAAIFMLAATVPSVVLPKLASAAQMQDRSIELSSATVSQTGVTYKINFDVASNYTMRGIIVDFCDGQSGSPIIGSSNCSLPTGMSVGTTISSMEVNSSDESSGWTAAVINDSHTLSLSNATGVAVESGDSVEIEVSGFTNSSAARTMYARILTYDTNSISAYESDSVLDYEDYGGVALSITQAIGVTATVQETLMFCVRGDNPTTQCGASDTPASPNITLGDGDPPVLRTTQADTGSVYYQVSTNAAQGVTIRMKGTTLQSGLNNIDAIGDEGSTLSSGEGFGFRTFGATSPGSTDGTVDDEALYATSNWAFDAINLGTTYGQQIAGSDGPVYDVNKQIEFAARAAGSTPAGVYTTNLSMVAVGRY